MTSSTSETRDTAIDVATSLPFRYRHIALSTNPQQIRLIKLNPELCKHGLLQCEIETFTLGQCPPYVALSYCWGPTYYNVDILVNGQPLAIRINLHHLLNTLRSDQPEDRRQEANRDWYRYSHIWVDQICIDQENVLERNHQVQQMREIYSDAAFVFAWLGSARENSDGAMDFLINKRWQSYEMGVAMDGQKEAPPSDEAEALRKLFSRPFWRRLWVVQEIILARNVVLMCGKRQIEWSDVQEFSREALIIIPNFFVRQFIDTRTENSAGRKLDLLEAIRSFSFNECADPRDKVYGLMGIVNVAAEDQLVIDYDLIAEDVFRKAVDLVLCRFDRLPHWIISTLEGLGVSMGVLNVNDRWRRFLRYIGKCPPGTPLPLELWHHIFTGKVFPKKSLLNDPMVRRRRHAAAEPGEEKSEEESQVSIEGSPLDERPAEF